MEKAKKAMSIKKLEKELKEEKQAEITRYVVTLSRQSWCSFPVFHSRKDITLERRKAAEERRRLEEEKAKVDTFLQSLLSY